MLWTECTTTPSGSHGSRPNTGPTITPRGAEEATWKEMEEEEVEGEGAIIGQAVHFRPEAREGNTAVVGTGILITASKRVAPQADRRRA